MPSSSSTSKRIVVATRGSALALAQAHQVVDHLRRLKPRERFEIKIIKTSGDKLQTASLAQSVEGLSKGLFTKELEAALLEGEADLAVHSLKDLPTELPQGLKLGAVCRRADVRDVLIYRDIGGVREEEHRRALAVEDWSPGQLRHRGFEPGLRLVGLPEGAMLATSSVRRQAQVAAVRPDLRFVSIRGNVGTRLQRLVQRPEIDAILLAAAGLARLQVKFLERGRMRAGPGLPLGIQGPDAVVLSRLLVSFLEPEDMLPCVGQAAIGLEVREKDDGTEWICQALNHVPTWQSVTAERTFLHALGGGCQTPVGAYARVVGHRLDFQAISFRTQPPVRIQLSAPLKDAAALGELAARKILENGESGGA
ncbi:MAG TPA: hydroxymethylbilane synthase [Candidatus Paceibacterota bacterium]|nr:hydroxymethylbilane synthase [Verrucomicrobiota bacterium]HRY50211.1 hydroxymethylbilane synthase [Candidatus Paceibacterota bacterium]